ncbi:MAG: anthranilate synthase component I family protein [Planctomycetaceae bacterium]|nr:anthranilate synthase component I family protein [Planctomycetaceae bacterium]
MEEAIRRFGDVPFLVLLDSASQIRARDARYTFLTGDPVETLRLESVQYGDDVFTRLRGWQSRLPETTDETLPPFCGGIAGFLSYEFGEAFEHLPRPAIDDFQTPPLVAGLFDWCLCWDHIRKSITIYVLAIRNPESGRSDPDERELESRMEWVRERLMSGHRAAIPLPPVLKSIRSPAPRHEIQPSVWSSFEPEQYLRAVSRVVEYIGAGDIFQANLSQRLTAKWEGNAIELYSRIRTMNPAPFCGLFIQPDFAIVSASPERFLKISNGRHVETRPIKGTRRRQQSPIADLFTSDELTSSEKDRAENVMIVDLLRNDLSRSCRPGSVRVTGLCEVERFETVQHLVSTVVGELRPECDVWDLIAGCFPGGSITGAPKIRAMQIIAELEPTVRGAYCGSLFCVGPRGDLDSSLLIRTFTLKNGLVQFPVGGGIVADSQPHDEYLETLHKASGMLRSLTAASSER